MQLPARCRQPTWRHHPDCTRPPSILTTEYEPTTEAIYQAITDTAIANTVPQQSKWHQLDCSPQPPNRMTTEHKPRIQSPENGARQIPHAPICNADHAPQEAKQCHQPDDTSTNIPRPPSSLTTENEPKVTAQIQQSQQQLPTRCHQPDDTNTMHLGREAAWRPSWAPSQSPNPANTNQHLPTRCHQPDNTTRMYLAAKQLDDRNWASQKSPNCL